VGGASLRPHLLVRQTYDDNVLYSSTTKTADLISVIAPGLGIMLGTEERNFLLFDYTARNYFYADQDVLNGTDHSLALRGRYQASRISVAGGGTLDILSGLIGGEIDRGKVNRTLHDSDYRISYDVTDKTDVYIGLSENGVDFQCGVCLVFLAQFKTRLGVYFDVSPKTTLFAETFYGQTHTHANLSATPDGSPSDFGGLFVGVKGRLASRFLYNAKAGYQVREYRSGASGPDGPVAEAALQYVLGERSDVDLRYTRRDAVSAQVIEESYVSDRISLVLRHRFGESGKLRASLGFAFVVNDYTGSTFRNRADEFWRVNFGLFYKMQEWLTGTLRYDYERFQSSLEGLRDYDVNRVSIEMTVGLL
jgi:hypothetical protein